MSIGLQREFLSSHYRRWLISSIQEKHTPKWIFLHASRTQNTSFLEIADEFAMQPHVRLEQMYFRQKTRTIVLNVGTDEHEIVLKIFYLQENAVPSSNATPLDKESSCLMSHDVEVKYLDLLSRLVFHHITPHIVLPIYRSIISFARVQKLLRSSVDASVLRQISSNKPTDLFMAIFAEKANHGTLTSLVRQDLVSLRRAQLNYVLVAIIFQIVYTLACIHIRTPSFKHNDLHTSNVLISSTDRAKLQNVHPSKQHYVRYIDENGSDAYIDIMVCPYRTLLWDFFFSSINEDDARRWNLGPMITNRTSIGISSCRNSRVVANQYTDIHKLIDTLEYILRGANLWGKLEPCMVNFFNDVVPEQYKCAARDRDAEYKESLKLHTVHHTTARDLLSHPLFNSLRHPIDNSVAPLETYDARRKLKEHAFPQNGK